MGGVIRPFFDTFSVFFRVVIETHFFASGCKIKSDQEAVRRLLGSDFKKYGGKIVWNIQAMQKATLR